MARYSSDAQVEILLSGTHNYIPKARVEEILKLKKRNKENEKILILDTWKRNNVLSQYRILRWIKSIRFIFYICTWKTEFPWENPSVFKFKKLKKLLKPFFQKCQMSKWIKSWLASCP